MSKKVFVSGCYDMLHSGHVAFFKEASTYGDLYVGIGSDATIRELKDRKTINTEQERLYMVKAIRYVKDAFINSGSGMLDFEEDVKRLKPDIFFVNSDGYTPGKKRFCEANGIELVVSTRIPEAGLPTRSTTALRQECKIPYRIDLAGGWCGKSFVLLTWGPDDVPMLRENMTAHKLSSEWLDCDYDLQRIYSRQREGGGEKQRSLEFAMDALGVEQTLPAHDALNDAYFTALVAQKLNTPDGVKSYGERGESYLLDKTFGDADIGEVGYASVEEVLASAEAIPGVCPLCGGTITACGKVLHGRGHRYRTLCRCPNDGDMFLTLKVFPNHNGTFRMRKMLTVADPADCEAYRKKLEDAAAKRKRRPRRRRRGGAKGETATAAGSEG